MKDNPLKDFAKNITSQYGEDGIIDEIFTRIGTRSKVCIEFGAWDGKYLSNTWHLWHDRQWSALLIEGDSGRHDNLKDSLAGYPQVKSVCAFVQSTGENSLDRILSRSDISCDIDLLSVDVDGDEYHIWSALVDFRPRVVVIEHNPTIPPELDLVQKPGEYFGASAGSLCRLAHEKGYRLAACTDTNSFFVVDEDFAKLGFEEPDLRTIFPRTSLSNIVNAYDGKMFLTQNPVYSHRIEAISPTILKNDLTKEIFGKDERLPAPVIGDQLTPIKVYADPARPPKQGVATRLVQLVVTGFLNFPPIKKTRNHFESSRLKRSVIREWRGAGSPVPPPHEIKQETIQLYARRHRVKVMVETGTYLGDMVAAMLFSFKRIYSIELGQELFKNACLRFRDNPSVKIVHGDSAVALQKVLKELDQPALFWLDGHYSEGITAKGELDTPIFSELDHIFAHRVKNHVLLIDDARCFTGSGDYPTLESLRIYIQRFRPAASFEVKDDVIRVVL